MKTNLNSGNTQYAPLTNVKNHPHNSDLPQPTTLLNLIKSRRSIRRYTGEPVSHQTILRLLEAATWAPSAHNRQPWRFAVLANLAGKERLAAAMGARLRADRAADGDAPADIERDVARSHARLTGAPVLIVVCLSMTDMDVYPDPQRARNEWVMAAQSAAMAAQNLLLMAYAEGLAACWLCAPLFTPELVRDTLNLAEDWQPQGIITLGYAAEEKEKTRASLETRVRFL